MLNKHYMKEGLLLLVLYIFQKTFPGDERGKIFIWTWFFWAADTKLYLQMEALYSMLKGNRAHNSKPYRISPVTHTVSLSSAKPVKQVWGEMSM